MAYESFGVTLMMAYESWLVERAKEELEMLESQHPTRFHHLKLELKSLISQPNFGAQLFPRAVDDDAFGPPLASAAVPTQGILIPSFLHSDLLFIHRLPHRLFFLCSLSSQRHLLERGRLRPSGGACIRRTRHRSRHQHQDKPVVVMGAGRRATAAWRQP